MIRPAAVVRLVLAALAAGTLAGAAPRVLAERGSTAVPARVALASGPTALEARPDGFLARGSRYDVLVRPNLQLVALRAAARLRTDAAGRPRLSAAKVAQAGFTLRYVGARPAARPRTSSPLAPVYHVGDGAPWTAPTYARVVYRGVYPGIDVAHHGRAARLQTDWLVAPGAVPGRIRIAAEGVDALSRRADGGVTVTAGGLHAVLTRPRAYQVVAGERRPVPAAWTLDRRTLGFALGAYDRSRPLVIDPQLAASVLVGGDDVDTFLDVDADSAGNLVAVGAAIASNFPRVGGGAFQPGGNLEGIVVTLSPSLQVLSTTVIGGLRDDVFQRVEAADPGEWIVSGATNSTDFPTVHALDASYGGGTCGEEPCFDALLLAFRGGSLRFSTYFGGAADDGITSLALDRSARGGSGLLVFGGFSNSAGFIRAAGYDGMLGLIHYEAIESLGAGSSYTLNRFGGAGADTINGVAVRGNLIHAVGGGRSTSQIVPGAFVQFQHPFVLYSRDAGAAWQERTYPGSAFSELTNVELDADGSAFASFIGFFPGGDYGACAFGTCQPAGFVELDGSSLAPGPVVTIVPPARMRYAVQDIDALRSASGAIEAIGASGDRFESFSAAATPTGAALLLTPGPRLVSRTELPDSTLAWGAAFAGDALFLAGVAPEGVLGDIRGEADAFVARFEDLGVAPCRCVSIATSVRGVSASRTGVRFAVSWRMTCTSGRGQCEGELAVTAPAGARLSSPSRRVHCGPRSCSAGAPRGSFGVTAAVAAPSRAGKSYSFRIREWCVVAGRRTPLPVRRITIAFTRRGAFDRPHSDLNGDGREDGM